MATKLPLKVINLFCGPGGGKSTCAAALFNLMKRADFEVELVTEFAKDLTYAKAMTTLDNQLLVLGEQDNRLRRLVGNCEWAITDSPLVLGAAYMSAEYRYWLSAAMWGAFDRYRNYNVLLERGARRYQEYGRNQTHEEALKLDKVVASIYDTTFHTTSGRMTIPSDDYAPYAIFEEVKTTWNR